MDFQCCHAVSLRSQKKPGATVSLRIFALQALLRAALICAAFYVGFIVIDAHAQTPSLSSGNVEGQLTSTEGKVFLPFFLGSRVGDSCNPFVDYNCEVSE